MFVVVDAERAQLFVAFVYIGVAVAREIAAVNVGSCERVTDAFAVVEVSSENFLLLSLRQFRKHFCRCISECATDSNNRLKSFCGIDEHADLGLEGLAHVLERQLVGLREAVISFVRGCVDRYFSALDFSVDLNGPRSFRWFNRGRRQ